MYLRDYRDVLAGGLLASAGIFVALYAARHYALGTLNQMGPGMFPVWLGAILAVIGATILISGLLRPGPEFKPDVRPFVAVIAGLVAFVLTVDVLGMIPAIVLLVAAAAFAERPYRPLTVLILGAALASIAVLVFRVGLGVPIEPMRWPF